MRESVKRYVEAAQSLTEVSRERAEKVARSLAGSGLISPDQIRSVASDLIDRSRDNRRRIAQLVAREIRQQVSRLGLASRDDVERLRQRVQALEVSQRTARRASSRPAARATVAKGRPAAGRKKPAAGR